MLILDELWYEHMNLEEHTKGDKEYFRELKTLADLGEKDAFISGLKLGVKMMIDVLHCA